MQHVSDIEDDLITTNRHCSDARRMLKRTDEDLVKKSLEVLMMTRKTARLQSLYDRMRGIAEVFHMESTMINCLAAGDIVPALHVFKQCSSKLDDLPRFNCLEPIRKRIVAFQADAEDMIRERLIPCAEAYDQSVIDTVLRCYSTIESLSTMARVVSRTYLDVIDQSCLDITNNHVSNQVVTATGGGARRLSTQGTYREVASALDRDSFVPCFFDVIVRMNDILHSYYCVDRSLDENATNEDRLIGSEHSAAELSRQVSRTRQQIWSRTQDRVSLLLSSVTLTTATIQLDEFLRLLNASYTFIAIGDTFSDQHSYGLSSAIQLKSKEYVDNFHKETFEYLRLTLENETWDVYPMERHRFDLHSIREFRAVRARTGVAKAPSDTKEVQNIYDAFCNGTNLFRDEVERRAAELKQQTAPFERSASSSSMGTPGQTNATRSLKRRGANKRKRRSARRGTVAQYYAAAAEAASKLSGIDQVNGDSDANASTNADGTAAAADTSATGTPGSMEHNDSKRSIESGAYNSEDDTPTPEDADAVNLYHYVKEGSDSIVAARELSRGHSGHSGSSIELSIYDESSSDDEESVVPILTTSSIKIAQFIGKYIQIMQSLPPLAVNALYGLAEVFDFYLYTLFNGFSPMTSQFYDAAVSAQVHKLYPHLHAAVTGIRERVELKQFGASTLTSSMASRQMLPVFIQPPPPPMPKPNANGSSGSSNNIQDPVDLRSASRSGGSSRNFLDKFSRSFRSSKSRSTLLSSSTSSSDAKVSPAPQLAQLHPALDLTSDDTLSGFVKRCRAVENMVFLVDIMKRMEHRIAILLPSNDQFRAASFLSYVENVVREFRVFMYRNIATLMVNMEVIEKAISKVSWNVSEPADKHNSYIEQLVGNVRDSVQKIRMSGDLPLHVMRTLFKELIEFVMERLLAAYTRARKCTPQGRASMSLDLDVFRAGMHQLTDMRPLPKWQFVNQWVKAVFIVPSEDDFFTWMQTNPGYTLDQYVSVAECGPARSMKRKAKQTFVDKIEKAYSTLNRPTT
jgi:Syndetin, C-terminal/Vacuolar-sorting protein 54, of GARP complex